MSSQLPSDPVKPRSLQLDETRPSRRCARRRWPEVLGDDGLAPVGGRFRGTNCRGVSREERERVINSFALEGANIVRVARDSPGATAAHIPEPYFGGRVRLMRAVDAIARDCAPVCPGSSRSDQRRFALGDLPAARARSAQ